MSVAACVTEVLCALGQPAVEGIKAVIQGQITAAEGLLAAVRAQLLAYDVALVPVTALQATADGILQTLEGYAALLPVSVVQGCVPLGDLNLGLAALIEPKTDEVRAFLDRLKKLLSFRDELADLEAFLVAQVQSLGDVLLALNLC